VKYTQSNPRFGFSISSDAWLYQLVIVLQVAWMFFVYERVLGFIAEHSLSHEFEQVWQTSNGLRLMHRHSCSYDTPLLRINSAKLHGEPARRCRARRAPYQYFFFEEYIAACIPAGHERTRKRMVRGWPMINRNRHGRLCMAAQCCGSIFALSICTFQSFNVDKTLEAGPHWRQARIQLLRNRPAAGKFQ
jgi:hypothetical protein